MQPKQAFTLIELLVVVLIIGILAAIALPQYQKAVLKSRYATLKDLTSSLATAQEVYYLANGQYASAFDQLDIDMPGGQLNSSTNSHYYYSWGNCQLNSYYVECRNKTMKYRHYGSQEPQSSLRGHRLCMAQGATEEKICQQETNDHTEGLVSDGYSYWKYK